MLRIRLKRLRQRLQGSSHFRDVRHHPVIVILVEICEELPIDIVYIGLHSDGGGFKIVLAGN